MCATVAFRLQLYSLSPLTVPASLEIHAEGKGRGGKERVERGGREERRGGQPSRTKIPVIRPCLRLHGFLVYPQS